MVFCPPEGPSAPPLLLSSLKAEGWDELTGPAIKAAATRASVAWLRTLARDFLVAGTPQDRMACELIDELAEFYRILYSAGRFISIAEETRLQQVCSRFGNNFLHLREHSRRSEVNAFQVKPNIHKMMHVPMLARVLNPRYVQNYCEESLVGTCTKVWARSVAGRYRQHAQPTVLTNKLVGQLLRYENWD